MKILALQLKRIGDLVLTTPALRALWRAWPEAHLTLGVMDGTATLLPAIASAQSGIVFGRALAPWQQVLTGGWDLCVDFTGNDRSALATALSRARQRATFEWVRRNKPRSLAYNTWCLSQVRMVHTTQHYLDLIASVVPEPGAASTADPLPELSLPVDAIKSAHRALRLAGLDRPFALLHPGTARPEKYWLSDRWGALAKHLRETYGLATVFTCGPDVFEQSHVAAIPNVELPGQSGILYPERLLTLAALAAKARLVVSCDTGVVHFAAAFRVPQVVLFGPTNPFHWRPLHDRAVVLSAARPDAPLAEFEPHLKGAPMDRISTGAVIRAIDSLLALPR